jgi:hypothetical protein
MNFNEIPKFVVNLKRRPDRLNSINEQMEYIDWTYEIFEAIDTNDHQGITKSTLAVLEIVKNRGYENFMIIEDDCQFMPYSKNLLQSIENKINNLEFGIFNLSPTLNRKVLRSNQYDLLLDLTNLPQKQEHERDIYALNMIIYNKTIYDTIESIKEKNFFYGGFYHALDEFLFKEVLQKKQSYSPILPVAPQMPGESNISGGYYNNFYLQTYNWNGYSPCKIPNEFLDSENNLKKIKEKKHFPFHYVS